MIYTIFEAIPFIEIEEQKLKQRLIATFSILIMWFKAFYWLHLFESTSFYIKLITSTLSDIAGLLVLLVVTAFMFGSTLYML